MGRINRRHDHGGTLQKLSTVKGSTSAVKTQQSLWNVAFIKIFVVMWIKQYQPLFSRELVGTTNSISHF